VVTVLGMPNLTEFRRPGQVPDGAPHGRVPHGSTALADPAGRGIQAVRPACDAVRARVEAQLREIAPAP
jgi:hypothetical protein